MYFLYDTETTGLRASDEVIQLAGLLVDDDLRIRGVINHYCNTTVPINPEAMRVHGITKEDLVKKSSGLYFEDIWFNLKSITEATDLTWIAYNDSFDRRLINQTLNHQGYDSHDFGTKILKLKKGNVGIHNYDLMQAFCTLRGKPNGRMSLSAATAYLKYTEQERADMFSKVLDACNLPIPENSFHNALYDSFMLYCILCSFAKELIE